MQTKYESRKHLFKRLFSDVICNEIELAYKKTVLNPVPVGADEVDLDKLKDATLMVIIYINRRAENEFDAMFTLDMADEKTPLLDTVAGNTFMESKLQSMLSSDAAESDALGGPRYLEESGSYALKKISNFMEVNDMDTYCVFKFPDEVDEALYKMAYTN